VLTLIGPDRPGLVESVAARVAAHGGNWLESRMAHLAGQFAGILRVEVPAERLSEPTYNSAMPPMSLEDRVREVVEHAPPDVLAVYLYGSRARGTASPTSDIDLGVLMRAAPPPALGGVARDLEDAVERAVRVPVEVFVLNRAAADLTHRVLRDGILLLDRDRGARIRFEVQARNEYFDLAPLRRLYRRLPA